MFPFVLSQSCQWWGWLLPLCPLLLCPHCVLKEVLCVHTGVRALCVLHRTTLQWGHVLTFIHRLHEFKLRLRCPTGVFKCPGHLGMLSVALEPVYSHSPIQLEGVSVDGPLMTTVRTTYGLFLGVPLPPISTTMSNSFHVQRIFKPWSGNIYKHIPKQISKQN